MFLCYKVACSGNITHHLHTQWFILPFVIEYNYHTKLICIWYHIKAKELSHVLVLQGGSGNITHHLHTQWLWLLWVMFTYFTLCLCCFYTKQLLWNLIPSFSNVEWFQLSCSHILNRHIIAPPALKYPSQLTFKVSRCGECQTISFTAICWTVVSKCYWRTTFAYLFIVEKPTGVLDVAFGPETMISILFTSRSCVWWKSWVACYPTLWIRISKFRDHNLRVLTAGWTFKRNAYSNSGCTVGKCDFLTVGVWLWGKWPGWGLNFHPRSVVWKNFNAFVAEWIFLPWLEIKTRNWRTVTSWA